MDMVKLYPVEEAEDVDELKEMLHRFWQYTGSERPHRILDNWEQYRTKFVKVYPNDYRRVIETQRRFLQQGLPADEAIMAAFEENARDLSRVGGN
jgi:glutamate synthase (ferredoxin)